MTRLRTPLLVTLGLLLVPGVAIAAWTATGSGDASSKAFSMPAGGTPTVSVTGRNVTVSWAAETFPNGDPVAGYVVSRYPDGGGPPQTVLPDCDGTVATTSCTERAVPAGTWRYTVTPVHGSWTGAEGPLSAAVTVGGASLSLSPTTVTSFPAGLSGSLTGFVTGETVTFRLDDPDTGGVLSGSTSPDPIPNDGQASVSVTLPNGTADGAHTVYAVGSQGTVSVDTTPPNVSAAVIAKTQGGSPGYVRQGGTCYVYANVSAPGSPSTGVSSVTADVSAITACQTAVPLTAGSYVVDGVTYDHASATLTADNPLAAGATAFSITAVDGAGNSATQGGFTVTVDNTPPSAADVQTANAFGGTPDHTETGDTITFTFSEPIDPGSTLAGWDGSAASVTVRLVNAGGNDRIEVWDAGATAQLPLGTVALAGNYTTANRTFTGSTMAMSGSTITVSSAPRAAASGRSPTPARCPGRRWPRPTTEPRTPASPPRPPRAAPPTPSSERC